jgi:hypothetical protein
MRRAAASYEKARWNSYSDIGAAEIAGACAVACAGALLEQPLDRAAAAEAMTDDLPFKVVRSNGTELARAMNLLIARVVTLLRRAYERLPPAACGSN